MIKQILLLGCIVLMCNTNSYSKSYFEVWQNEKINVKVKTEISELNKEVYKYMCDADYKSLSSLFSDSLKKYIGQGFETKFMPQIQTVIKGKEYKVFDEFYVKNTIPDSVVTINAGKGEYAYTFELLSSEKESYISLLTSGDTSNLVMITVIYSNINGKWKLNVIRGEDYSLSKMNAVDLFNYSHKLRGTGDIIDALNFMSVATHCSTPGGAYFKYSITDHMKDYTDTLNFESMQKYPFPYAIEQMKSKPSIFNIHLEMQNGTLTPMVVYQTTLYLKDTNALKVENDEMHKKIGTIFTGMDKNNKTILYRAYNEKPNGQNSPAYFGFVKKVD